MRLALRTLFWITLAVAVGVGWFIDHKKAADRYQEVRGNTLGLDHDPGPSEDSRKRRRRLAELEKLSDGELRRVFTATQPAGWADLYSEYDLCLIEMARRKMTTDLQQAYDRLMTDRARSTEPARPSNTKLLIALRRSQGHPDPLKVHLSWKPSREPNAVRPMPLLVGTIENVDVGNETIDLLEGMDYRTGRRTRWRVHLYDQAGNRMPDANFGSGGTGGGLGTSGVLTHGEKGRDTNSLDARYYVKPPPSGKYKLQIVHSPDCVDIADEPDLSGLIVLQSELVDVVVTGPTPQPTRRSLSVLPLLAVLSTACLGSVVMHVARRKRPQDASRPVPTHWLTTRDLVALIGITLLAAGWHFDVGRLERQIQELQPDHESDWTMRPAE